MTTGVQKQSHDSCSDDEGEDAMLLPNVVSSEGVEGRVKAPRGQPETSIWLLGLAVGVAYALNYFTRYPVFILPSGPGEILSLPVATLWGRTLDTQVMVSVAFTVGFGCGKLPAVFFMSSPFFFRHRLSCVLVMMWGTMLIVGVGIRLFYTSPIGVVLCVFFACCIQSWLYGAIFTYIEGRQKTETLIALMAAMYIFAGNLSRGSASLVLTSGLPPEWMPLLVGGVACSIASALVVVVDRMPGPSLADVRSRSKRQPMSTSEKWIFCREYALGLVLMCLGYAGLMGLRSFRDFYSKPIFAAAMNKSVDNVPSWIFFVVDVPGAVLSCIALIGINRHFKNNNRNAMRCLLLLQVLASVVLVLGSTLLFRFEVIGGVAWQITLGTGIYITMAMMQAPVLDRLLAASHTQGTCTFMIFLSDLCAYVVTFVLLFYQIFGPLSSKDSADGPSPTQVLDLYSTLLLSVGSVVALTAAGALAYFTLNPKLALTGTRSSHEKL